MPIDGMPNRLAVGRAGTDPGQYDNIEVSQVMPCQAEAFPDETLHAISVHRMANGLLGNGQAEAGVPQHVGTRQHRQIGVGRFFGFLEDTLEVGGRS